MPNSLNIANTPITMTSIELLEVVNQARALHGEGDIRRNDFTARCMDELAGEHYESFVVRNPNGTASEALRMTRDQCLYVLMRESKSVRRTATEQLNKPAAPAIPTTLSAALRLAADQADQIEQQQAQLAIAAPKAQALDRIADAEGSMCITDAAKHLQMQPKHLFSWLAANDWIYRRPGNAHWIAYQPRLKAGVLDHKVALVTRGDGTEKVVEQVLVTAKGLARLAKVAA